MMWALLIFAGVVAIPLVIEAARKPMNDRTRATAPGQFVDLPQGKTHYQWYGPEDGPTALCIHGLTTPSFVWQSTAQALADMGYHVLTYDLFGRGFSDRPLGRQDSAFFLKQLNDLLDSQKVEDDITVLGYSMGGAIAAAFAASQPNGIRHVILLAPAGMKTSGMALMRILIRVPIVGFWLLLVFYPELLRKGLRAEADLETSVPDINALQEAELNYRGFLPAIYQSLRGMLGRDLRTEHVTLKKEGLPVLAIWGAEDDVIPLQAKDLLCNWNDTVQTIVVEGAGHGLTYTHTDVVLDAVRDFFRDYD